MLQYLAYYLPIIFILFGVLLIILEIFIISGKGLLFIGLGFLSAGLLMALGILDNNGFGRSFSIFFGLSLAWAAILYVPIQKYQNRDSISNFESLKGQIAVICEHDLKRATPSKVAFGGKIYDAVLSRDSRIDVIQKGTEAKIVGTAGNTIIVEPKNNDKYSTV